MWTELGLAQLKKWGDLSIEDAEACGLFEVADASEIYADFKAIPAIIIPYYNPDMTPMTFLRGGEELPFCRVRYLGVKDSKGFTTTKAVRYGQPKKSGTRAYFCPLWNWPAVVDDPDQAIIITEGEAKAIIGCRDGFPVLALGGVYNFTNGGDELMAELEAIKWGGRDVYICFDSDAPGNPNIMAAEARLVDQLQAKRGAKGFLVRIPQLDDDKVGLDDFLAVYGGPAFKHLLEDAEELGALEAKIISLNKSVAWIEKEGQIYDIGENGFIQKHNFTSGSKYSSIKHITVGGSDRKAKRIGVANEWLTSTFAQRFGEVLFRPGEGRVVTSEAGHPAMNMWGGWPYSEPNLDLMPPFLELTKHVFSKMPPDQRDLPLKLMAYKLQHPERKVPLCLVLLGPQGSGKSLWTECIAEAFRPYGSAIPASQFGNKFQGFMERNLLCVVNEAERNYVAEHGERLKSLISDIDQYMDEKFRPARSIKSYTMYILSANDPAVGSFAHDDRRMIVIGVPKPVDAGNWPIYNQLGKDGPWRANGGGPALRHYLLTMDLGDWRPPARAPMTPEKHMAYIESLTPGQALAEEMKSADEQTIELWLDQATAWAQVAEVGNNPTLAAAARATMDGVKHMQIRPFYEPRELALLFPNLIQTLMGSKYDRNTSAGKISRELRAAGVPYLTCSDDPNGFRWKGLVRQYLVIAEFDNWEEPLSQNEFERLMNNFPTYGQRRRPGK